MKRSLEVLAATAAVCAPAISHADTSPVTVYGLFNVSFESVEAGGGAAAAIDRRNRVTTNTGSHIGFRGAEKVGAGLEAWFQLETNAPLDASTTSFANRNSAVGLRSKDWGTALLGRWDTPYKVSTIRLDPNYTTIGGYTGITHGNGGGIVGNVTNRFGFDRRQQNTVQYWSPSWGGVSIRAAYGANEEKNATVNPSLFSTSVAWQNATFYVGAAYEEHRDYGPAGSKDKAAQVFGQAKLGPVTLGLMGERLKWNGFGAATASYKGSVLASSAGGGLEVSDWFVSVQWKSGAGTLALSYGWDQEVKLNGASDSTRKAKQTSLRYGYDFSKRTQLYAMATKLDNQANSANIFGFNTIGNTAGQDPQGIGVGMIHRF